jgi:hypothetical protein
MPVRYEEDLYAWSQETAQALLDGRLSDVSLDKIAEEIRSLGIGEERALISQLARIMRHLLKIRYQPGRHSRSWDLSVIEGRGRLAVILRRNPSLRHNLAESVRLAYAIARPAAARETGIDLPLFPAECPFTAEEVVG